AGPPAVPTAAKSTKQTNARAGVELRMAGSTRDGRINSRLAVVAEGLLDRGCDRAALVETAELAKLAGDLFEQGGGVGHEARARRVLDEARGVARGQAPAPRGRELRRQPEQHRVELRRRCEFFRAVGD